MGEQTYAELRRVARALRDDDSAAREHLVAGRWIVYREADTPLGCVTSNHRTGKCHKGSIIRGKTSDPVQPCSSAAS